MDLRTFTFSKGSHARREDGLCVMEAVAMLAGEKHSDEPACACPVITKLAIWLNDSCGDELRQELLLDMPWRIVGTRATPDIEQQRAFMAADWAVRLVCPILMRRVGLTKEAAALESLPVVNSCRSARAASYAAREASYASDAAAYAAREASDAAADAADAAADAADVAAYAAYAAREASYASDAAAHAVRAAARAAACAADDLETIQRSCAELLDRMIRLTEPQEVCVVTQQVCQAL